MTRPRLKGCTDTEFQACARYLLGISSRHISVVTHRKTNHILPPLRRFQPPRARARPLDTRGDILFAKSPLSFRAVQVTPRGCSYLVCTGISRLAARDAQISWRSSSYPPFLSLSFPPHISTFHLTFHPYTLFFFPSRSFIHAAVDGATSS